MLAGALGQLFLNLDKIAPCDRSEYEDALHRELLELARRLQPLPSAEPVDAVMLRKAIETATYPVNLRVGIDLGPAPSDVKGFDALIRTARTRSCDAPL